MSFRFVALLLGWVALLPPACGPDPKPRDCSGNPDFEVVIRALGGDLPGDTVVVLIYGSGREEYRLNEAGRPEVLFCEPANSEGEPLGMGMAGEGAAPPVNMAGAGGAVAASGTGGAGGIGGGSGAGGAGGAPTTSLPTVPTLFCRLWTLGPATLEISAEGYPEHRAELELRRDLCTVSEEIEIVRGDAGM